jgi:uracil-DNA glycosylase
LILKAAHPSPLSVTGFLGCRHFSKTNEYMVKNGIDPIDWSL